VPALHPPELTDGEIRLRALRASDRDAMVAAAQDPEIPRWTRVPSPYTGADFERWLAEAARQQQAGEGLHLAVVAADDGRLLGTVGVQQLHTAVPDIGYWVGAGARRRGVAARAVRLLRDWLARELGRRRIEILVHVDNTPSQRTALRAGFARTGEYREDPRDLAGTYAVFAWPDDGGAGGGAG